MNIEDQVCSLELGRRLKNFGTPNHSLFYYNYFYDKITCDSFYTTDDKTNIPLFTASELFQILPSSIGKEEKCYRITITKFIHVRENKNAWMNRVSYDCADFQYINQTLVPCYGPIIAKCDENLANALAETLIFLLEEKLIKVE